MSALKWRWYLPRFIQETADRQWRIYKQRDLESGDTVYTLYRHERTGFKFVTRSGDAQTCKRMVEELSDEAA